MDLKGQEIDLNDRKLSSLFQTYCHYNYQPGTNSFATTTETLMYLISLNSSKVHVGYISTHFYLI